MVMDLLMKPRPSYMPKYVPKAGDGCVLYLEGQQDPQSATIRDLSGYNNHGTITGATWTRLSSGLWVNSFITDDFIDCGGNASLNLQVFTFMGWLYTTSGADQCILSGGVNGGSNFGLLKLSTPSLRFDDFWVAAPISYNVEYRNKWHQVGIHRDAANNASIVYDGTLQSTGVYAGVFGFSNLLLGKRADALELDGKLALWKGFNRALSATEIAGIFQSERHLFQV